MRRSFGFIIAFLLVNTSAAVLSANQVRAEVSTFNAPTNDDIGAASSIENGSVVTARGSVSASNVGGSLEVDETSKVFELSPESAEATTSSVWFKIRLSPGKWRISTTDVTVDHILAIGTVAGSPSISDFTLLARGDWTGYLGGTGSYNPEKLLVLSVPSETTYYIAIANHDYLGSTGTFTLNWTPIDALANSAPVNNNFADRLDLNLGRTAGQPVFKYGLTVEGATLEQGETAKFTAEREDKASNCDGDEEDSWCPDSQIMHTVWFEVTLGVGKWSFVPEIDSRTRGDNDQTLGLFTSSSSTPTFQDLTNVTNGPTLLRDVTAETKYYIAYSFDYWADHQPVDRLLPSFDLRIRPVVAVNAVSSVQASVADNFASVSWDVPSNSGSLSVFDLGYTVELQHESYLDPAVPQRSWPVTRSCRVHEQWFQMTNSFGRACDFDRLAPGRWYVRIMVFDYDQYVGGSVSNSDFQVTAQWNDSFSAQTVLSGQTGSEIDNVGFATLEPNEPVHGETQTWSSLWYSFTPPSTGTYTFSSEGTFWAGAHFQMLTSVFEGDSLGSLRKIAYGRSATFDAAAGSTYRIAVSLTSDYMFEGFSDFGQDQAVTAIKTVWNYAAPPVIEPEKSEGVPSKQPTTETPAPAPVVPETPQVVTPSPLPPSVTPVSTTANPVTITASKPASLKTLASSAGLSVPKGAKTKLVVAGSSKRYCKVVGTTVRAVASGKCVVTVSVTTPAKGKTKAVTKTKRVTLTVNVPKKAKK